MHFPGVFLLSLPPSARRWVNGECSTAVMPQPSTSPLTVCALPLEGAKAGVQDHRRAAYEDVGWMLDVAVMLELGVHRAVADSERNLWVGLGISGWA